MSFISPQLLINVCSYNLQPWKCPQWFNPLLHIVNSLLRMAKIYSILYSSTCFVLFKFMENTHLIL